MRAPAPRVLFYSHNGVGVGHFRRQLKLAAVLRSRIPEAEVLMATGAHTARALNADFGFACLELPSIRMVDRYRTWEPRARGPAIAEVIAQRAALLRNAVRRMRPDLLVADFMPAGPYGELIGALEELGRAGGRAIAGFRDIYDAPDYVSDLWAQTGVVEVLRAHYAEIWVYGTPEVTDYATEYGLNGELADRIHYLGYLAPPVTARPPGSPPAITACAGGGADGGALLRCFVEAVRRLGPERCAGTVVVGGPLLAAGELDRLRVLAHGSTIDIRPVQTRLEERIAHSDLVVTMPGYNTACELLASAARGICVPRSGPSLEQRLRAGRLAQWGRATVLEPDGLDGSVLAEAIETELARPLPPPAPVPLDGLDRVADRMTSLLGDLVGAGG